MQFKLDLVSQSLRPEYEALRENLKQIRLQCLDDSPRFLNGWRDAIESPPNKAPTAVAEAGGPVLKEPVPVPKEPVPVACGAATMDEENDEIAAMAAGGLVSDFGGLADNGDTELRLLPDHEEIDVEQRRREFGQKLLEILASEEFNVFREHFNVPRDLESVLSALTSNSNPCKDQTVEDVKIRGNLEKLFYEVVKSPECQHYKTIVREKSARFADACAASEARRRRPVKPPDDKAAAPTATTLGLVKLCEPFGPAADGPAESAGNVDAEKVSGRKRRGQGVIAPFIDCLLLLVAPEFSLGVF